MADEQAADPQTAMKQRAAYHAAGLVEDGMVWDWAAAAPRPCLCVRWANE